MSRFYSNDPIRDAEKYSAYLEERATRVYPKCSVCDETIFQSHAVYWNETDEWVCEECEWDFWKQIRKDYLQRTVDE